MACFRISWFWSSVSQHRKECHAKTDVHPAHTGRSAVVEWMIAAVESYLACDMAPPTLPLLRGAGVGTLPSDILYAGAPPGEFISQLNIRIPGHPAGINRSRFELGFSRRRLAHTWQLRRPELELTIQALGGKRSHSRSFLRVERFPSQLSSGLASLEYFGSIRRQQADLSVLIQRLPLGKGG